MPLLVLTTDFGVSSPYVAAMKGVIWSIHPAVTIADLTHAIAPQDVLQAAYVLGDFAATFPPETIHVVVVDPGVGTRRRILYARVGNQRFVLPDNGLLTVLLQTAEASELIAVENPRYWRDPVAATFHGRDIMAPVAAHLSLGVEATRLGVPVTEIQRLELPDVKVGPRWVVGRVVAVDSFGNLVTNITAGLLDSAGCPRQATVTCGACQIRGIVATYGDSPTSSLVALVGSAGRLEIAVVNGNASRERQIGPLAEVCVRW